MASSMTKVLGLSVLFLSLLSLSLLLCNMEAQENRLFNKEPAYDNPNGGSNTAGYAERCVTSSDRGMGNGYHSYRTQRMGEASRAGSGGGAGYGEAGSGYPRCGSGKGAEYHSGGSGGSGDDSGYRQSPGNAYTPYPPGSNGGYGADRKYVSGYGKRWEKSDAYGSGYSGGNYVTVVGNVRVAVPIVTVVGSRNGNGYFGGSNGDNKETP